MESMNTQKRITKRAPNACSRCRKHKIKCSGLQPCENCIKRQLTCIFDDRDNKILVTQGYISDLQQKIKQLEQSRTSIRTSPRHTDPGEEAPRSQNDARYKTTGAQPIDQAAVSSATNTPGSQHDAGETPAEIIAADLSNPLAESPSTFLSASDGRPFYLGTSSNWSFLGRVLRMTHEHVYQVSLPSNEILFDGTAYDLGWDGTGRSLDRVTPVIPSLDHAIYLINAVKFHCGQLFHLFEEEDFTARMHQFYSEEHGRVEKAGLWFIHFLLILAFGKTINKTKLVSRKASGIDFFVSAMQRLPDITALCRDPVVSTEILCCIALYLQSIDHRNSAHVFIGQAMRVALGFGMHTDMPVLDLGEKLVQRCRKVWWTIYVLDRQMTSLMGLPQSIRDEDINCQLPSFQGSSQRLGALKMQIKLARITSDINSSIYGITGRLEKRFLMTTKAALAGIAGLAEELYECMPLHLGDSTQGVSRMSAYLHLLYHQCIVLATRPLMFCCLKIGFESPSEAESFITFEKVHNLIQICVESAKQIIVILENVHTQGLLETFLPFDLDALFVSTLVLLLGNSIDPNLVKERAVWLERSFDIMDEMEASGNLISSFRKSGAQKLDEMFQKMATLGEQTMETPSSNQKAGGLVSQPAIAPLQPHGMPTPTTALEHNWMASESDHPMPGPFDELFTAEQIMAVASSIENEDSEWMARTMVQNSIW